MTTHLFSPVEMRGLTLANRIIVSPMAMWAADEGTGNANDWHLAHWAQWTMSNVGLLVIEATGVEPRGRISPECMGLYCDENERALGERIAKLRSWSDVPIGIQLAHSGRKGSRMVPWKGRDPLPAAEGWTPVGPSAVPVHESEPPPDVLDRAGMDEIRDFFVDATRRADRAGIDLIELHAAHGYLLSSFLSPLVNRRDDDYGGSTENRMRYPLEVFEAMRAAWPDEKPLGVRISGTDWVDGGWTPEESVIMGRALLERGCDYLCLSSAGNARGVLDPVGGRNIPLGPLYQVPLAEKVKREAGIPTMAVGMITEPEQAEAILAEGRADMIAIARQFMYEPHWVWRAADTLGVELDYPRRYERCARATRPAAFVEREAAE
ncbi:MAG: NADH:flavin oxidoreductase/NADH oxidase [Alphaproteobacteria bacterium]